MMNHASDHQKLAQNDHLAKLRANISLEKTVLAAKLKQQGQ
jgi:hypothetical protein